MTRTVRDRRFGVAVEAATDILVGDFGIELSSVVVDRRVRRSPSYLPQVYDEKNTVGVVIGILREDSLLKLLDIFGWIVHLPLPEEFGVYRAPTHFRCFKRSQAVEWSKETNTKEIWGGNLTHSRSKLTLEQKAAIDARRLSDDE